jgi:hypothetical protein
MRESTGQRWHEPYSPYFVVPIPHTACSRTAHATCQAGALFAGDRISYNFHSLPVCGYAEDWNFLDERDCDAD